MPLKRMIPLVLLFLTGCATSVAAPMSTPAPTTAPTAAPVVAPTATERPAPPIFMIATPNRSGTLSTDNRPPVPIRPPIETATPVPQEPPVAPATAEEKANLRFEGTRAYQHALDQCAIGPRPPGSPALQKTRDYITDHLRKMGWTVELQPFDFQGVQVINIIAKKGQGPITILGAHFDTRPIADKDPDPNRRQTPIIGGNDGASGVGVLMELARVWEKTPPAGETWLAFFDAEDSGGGGRQGWPWVVGSEYMAANLTVSPKQVIVVDMIGDNDQQIYYEQTSNPTLNRRVFDVAAALGYERWFIRQPRWSIIDDHTPFLQRGISAIDLIDFDYPYHHTFADDCSKIGPPSLERVGRTLELFMRRGG